MIQSDNIKEYCNRINLSYIPLKLSSIILKAQESQYGTLANFRGIM